MQLSLDGAIMRPVLKKERRNWLLPEPLRAQPGLEAFSSVFRQILHGRGVTRQSQLDPWLQTDLERAPDPFLMKDMAVACELIADAVHRGERIAVYGDYDADGVTACVTLARGLRSVGADVITYIPNRFTEGYGLNAEALKELHARGARLVITCDCGTNSVDVARGRPAGMRLIVTDHHEVGEERPPVDALINPKQADCPYPFDGLAACGVAYKLLVALEQRAFPGRLDPAQSLDAVALGTVADVVPLHGENRAIVRAGLQRLNQAPGAGCAALLAVAGISGPVTAEHLAFQLGPRINAAGRIEGFHLVDCLHDCAPLLHRFGGHAMAAGLTVRSSRFAELKGCLEAYAAARLNGDAFSRPVRIEASAAFADLKPSLHHEIQMLSPFGVGNREPLLLSRAVEVTGTETFSAHGRHLQVHLRDQTATAEASAADKGPTAPHRDAGQRSEQ